MLIYAEYLSISTPHSSTFRMAKLGGVRYPP
nr:MAG TPA: hypothetical protein [Caudoviricetes sp.]